MGKGAPPVLPPAGTVGTPADWQQHFAELFPGVAPPAAAAPPASYSGPPSLVLTPKEQAAGGEPSSPFWEGLLRDIEVYGFLLLLAAIGLYGLFAPQVNTVVQTGFKAAKGGV
jgi:hypothetical protein